MAWQQANPFAIRNDDWPAGQWEAGRVNSVLVLSSGEILIGTDGGGVWESATRRVNGRVAAARAADGRIEIFAPASDPQGNTHLWHLWQTSPNGDWIDYWEDLSTYRTLNATIVRGAAVAPAADGRLEIFVPARNKQGHVHLYHLWQTTPNGDWIDYWEDLSTYRTLPVDVAGEVAAGRAADGRLEIFVPGSDGHLYHLWQTTPSGDWINGWEDLSTYRTLDAHVVIGAGVGSAADGRLEIFVPARNTQGIVQLYHLWQTTPNGDWINGWEDLSTYRPLNASVTQVPAVGRAADGRLEIFVAALTAQRAQLYHLWQTTPNGDWINGWEDLSTYRQLDASVSAAPTVAPAADGRLEIFVPAINANKRFHLYHLWQTAPNGDWINDWEDLSTYRQLDPNVSWPTAVSPAADGRLEIFPPCSDGHLYHLWQTAPNGDWVKSWEDLSTYRPLGPMLPLSDGWDNPDITCLAAGPDGNHHAYAGCSDWATNSALLVSNTSSQTPLSDWLTIPLPETAGAVRRITVLPGVRKIVIATANGIWWSPIPKPASNVTLYNWHSANGIPTASYTGLALGPNDTIVAAMDSGSNSGVIFSGGWDASDNLTLTPASVDQSIQQNMTLTVLASSVGTHYRHVYAATAKADGSVLAVLHSTDGGKSFAQLPLAVQGGGDLASKAGTAQGSISIDVSAVAGPGGPTVLALGWQSGPWMSTNDGQTWRAISGVHGDQRALHFDPSDFLSNRLYIGSDGGLTMTPDLGGQITYLNARLLNLQFLSPTGRREFWGTLGISPVSPAGLMGGGLQDNGNVYCSLFPNPTAWKHLDGGDGGLMEALSTGDFVHYIQGNGPQPVSRASWNAGASRLEDQGPVPVQPSSTVIDFAIVEAVEQPSGTNPIYAVAGDGPVVLGLFGTGTNTLLKRIGSLTLGSGDRITAIGSFDGTTIFVGTDAGRIFRINSGDGSSVECTIANPTTDRIGVHRIVLRNDQLGFATYNAAADKGQGWVLITTDGRSWQPVPGSSLPVETFFGLAADWAAKPFRLYVATDSHVYSSSDSGGSWQDISRGLPARPHGTELRVSPGLSPARSLYLGTFGRSVWRLPLHN